MPVVSPPAKVLVSGANGYIAIWVVRTLLDRGYSVRAAVRSESKTKDLRKNFKNEFESGSLELAIVPDITVPGAFDEAVKDVDAIEHTASPFHFKSDDPSELIDPAVRGTVGILESALKHAGTQLKRVVVTSSVAAIMNSQSKGILDESVWNELSTVVVREKGREASPVDKYQTSKTLAEKAAWDFVADNKSSLSWDLVTICPPWVFGPVLNDFESPSEFGTSMEVLYNLLKFKNRSQEEIMDVQGGWIDVRDLADGHVRALEVPEAGGQRFILSSGEYTGQDWLDAAKALNIPGFDVEKGTPGAGKGHKYAFTYSSAKARNVLGMNFRNIPTTVKDVIEYFKEHGW